jgi:p25-alpha
MESSPSNEKPQQPQADEPASPTASPDSNGAATSGGDKAAKAAHSLADTFKLHASKSGGSEATGADISKWCKDAGVTGKTCDPGHIDISFTKVKQKGAK